MRSHHQRVCGDTVPAWTAAASAAAPIAIAPTTHPPHQQQGGHPTAAAPAPTSTTQYTSRHEATEEAAAAARTTPTARSAPHARTAAKHCDSSHGRRVDRLPRLRSVSLQLVPAAETTAAQVDVQQFLPVLGGRGDRLRDVPVLREGLHVPLLLRGRQRGGLVSGRPVLVRPGRDAHGSLDLPRDDGLLFTVSVVVLAPAVRETGGGSMLRASLPPGLSLSKRTLQRCEQRGREPPPPPPRFIGYKHCHAHTRKASFGL